MRRLGYLVGELVQIVLTMCIALIWSSSSYIRGSSIPQTVGLTSAQEEKSITPQRRCKPVYIVPSTSWKDFLAILRNPTHKEVRRWMRKGEMATWPLLRTLHVRMDVERELYSTPSHAVAGSEP